MATGNFYTFSKRKNSTLQPTGSGTQIDLQLKSGTSLISPTFLISHSGRPAYNYVTFEGRNYFVNDVTSVRNDLWEMVCTEDFLGTWKTNIGSTSAMILYATGGSSDIIDQRIPVSNTAYVDHDAVIPTGDFSGFTSSTEGIAIISVTGEGTCGNYLVSAVDVPNLLKGLSIWDLSAITDAATGFQQWIRGDSAPNNLRSAIYLPIILSSTSNFDPSTQIWLGKYPCTDTLGNPITGMRVNNPFLYSTGNVDIPWRYNDWRRNAPYTKVYAYIPLFGVINLPSQDIIMENSLTILYSLNMLGGDLAFQLRGNGSGRVIATGSCNIAMQTPYGASNISGGKVLGAVGVGISSVAAVALGAVTGGAATLALGSGLAASAGGLISALGGESAGGGGLSGSASTGLDLGVKITTISRDLTDSQSSVNPILGKPVFAKATIGSYSGFVQTDGAQVAGDMFDQERDTINRFLDGGIYYE